MSIEEMKRQPPPLYGLVLIGGKSKRMGKDKFRLRFHNTSQHEYCFDLLLRHCNQVFVSCRRDQMREMLDADLPCIVDQFEGLGPLGGLLTAMMKGSHAAWLVLACDLPFVDDRAIDNLVDHRNPLKMATAFPNPFDGKPEPLCTIYEPHSRIQLLNNLRGGFLNPRKTLADGNIELIKDFREFVLTNVDTREDLKTALSDLSKGMAH